MQLQEAFAAEQSGSIQVGKLLKQWGQLTIRTALSKYTGARLPVSKASTSNAPALHRSPVAATSEVFHIEP